MRILFDILDTASLDCQKAINSEMSNYEDAVMVETAVRSGMDCIVTRNIKDHTRSSVDIYGPDILLSLLDSKN